MTVPKPLIVVGGGGHGKVVADAAIRAGRTLAGFLDANPQATLLDLPLLGDDSRLDQAAFVAAHDFVVAIGAQAVRARLSARLAAAGALAAVIHPSAVVAASARIGGGSVVLAQAVINPEARLGLGVIVNVCASVDHDTVLGDNVQVGPGARLTGGVHVGDDAFIGAGAVIMPGITVGRAATVGAGAVVTRAVGDGIVVTGIPARPC